MMDDLSKQTPDEGLFKSGMFLAKSLLGLMPGGGTVSEFLTLVIADPSQRRRDRYLTDLAERLDQLAAQGKTSVSELLAHEETSAILLHSVQIAIRSTGDKQLHALREAAVRGALNVEKESTAAFVVMGIIDRLTDYHIQVLVHEAGEPRGYRMTDVEGRASSRVYGGPTYADPTELTEPKIVFSELRGETRYAEKSVVRNLWLAHSDLVALGLLKPVYAQEYVETEHRMQELKTTMDIAGYEVSELGRYVLEFITEQPDSDRVYSER